MVIIRSWLYPRCTFKLLYTTLNLKACKINNATRTSAKSKKVCDVSKEWEVGGLTPEERQYDAARGQNRYVTLP